MKWQQVLDIHASAATSLVDAAQRISDAQWLEARAEGKWSAAQVLQHLNLTYDVLLRELEGGTGMNVVTTLWQRTLLRFTVVPKILRGGWFPNGARAPREIRPTEVAADKETALAAFRDRSKRFDAVAIKVRADDGGRKLSHAYFGRAGVKNSVLLCARHIEHHTRQLNELAG